MQVEECAPGVYRILNPDAADWEAQDVAVYDYGRRRRQWACERHPDAWENNPCEHIKAAMECEASRRRTA